MLVVMVLRAGATPLPRHRAQRRGRLAADADPHAARPRARRHPSAARILPTSLPQLEYALTEPGRSKAEPVLAFRQWVREHLDEFDAARERYDRSHADPAAAAE